MTSLSLSLHYIPANRVNASCLCSSPSKCHQCATTFSFSFSWVTIFWLTKNIPPLCFSSSQISFHFFFVYGEEDWTRFRSNSSRSLLPRHFYQFFFPFSLYYLLYTVWWPMIVRFYSPHTLLTRVYIIIISRYDKERMVEEKKLGNDAEAERKSTEDVYNKLISIFFLSSVFARLFDRETSWKANHSE